MSTKKSILSDKNRMLLASMMGLKYAQVITTTPLKPKVIEHDKRAAAQLKRDRKSAKRLSDERSRNES